ATVRYLDEEGIVIYPIRYDTRATTERLAREQSEQVTPSLPTIDTIRKPPPSGTTAPTFPGGDGVPTTGTTRKTGPLGLPLPEEIMRRRREEERRRRDPNGDPTQTPPDRRDDPSIPGSTSPSSTRPSRSSEDGDVEPGKLGSSRRSGGVRVGSPLGS